MWDPNDLLHTLHSVQNSPKTPLHMKYGLETHTACTEPIHYYSVLPLPVQFDVNFILWPKEGQIFFLLKVCLLYNSRLAFYVSRMLILVCFTHQGEHSTASKVLHKVSVAKNTKIPICALLAILEIQEDRLLVPAVNHHRVNANSKNYKELEKYLCNCISENSDETLDLIMEGVMFKQEKTKFPTSVPFAFAEDTTL